MKQIKVRVFITELLGACNMQMCIIYLKAEVSYAAFHLDQEPYQNL